MVTATDLIPYGYGFKQISKHETFSKNSYGGNSFDLEYEFETPDSEQNDPMYMNVRFASDPNIKDAMVTEGIERASGGLGLKLGNLKQQPVKGAKTYGNSSSLNLLTLEGAPVGNYFICRQGKRTCTITMTGTIYFDDPAEWDDAFGTKITNWLQSR